MARGVRRFFGDPTPIQKNYLVTDYLADTQGVPLQRSVHIQVGTAGADAVRETAWLQSVAESTEGRGFPHGIVAFCDLSRSDAARRLDAHSRYPNLRGIRQIIGRSPEEDLRTGSDKILDNPVWCANLARLAKLDLSFDLQIIPQQLDRARRLLAGIPELAVALCHCGSPWDQSTEGLASWRSGLQKLATLPNVYCKISGFGMFDHGWTVASIRPIVEAVLDIFGVERCMFGSNFPVDKLYSEFSRIWRAYDEITCQYSANERQQLFAGTAHRFYRLTVDQEADTHKNAGGFDPPASLGICD